MLLADLDREGDLEPMDSQKRVLDHLQRRLDAAIRRSPLLQAVPTRAGRLLDISRLDVLAQGFSLKMLEAIVDGGKPLNLNLRSRGSGGLHSSNDLHFDDEPPAEPASAAKPAGPEPNGNHEKPKPNGTRAEIARAAAEAARVEAARMEAARVERAQAAERLAREQHALYDLLDRRVRRHADLAKRETGVHCLWLGYPLLYVAADDEWLLAPLFLWPIDLQLDLRQEGRIKVSRDPEAGPPQFNRAMATWILRQLRFDPQAPSEEDLEELNWAKLPGLVQQVTGQFGQPPNVSFDAPLEPIPDPQLLNPRHSPRLLHSAVLGFFRWQNAAILTDLETIKNQDEVQGVVSTFLTGQSAAQPITVSSPPEDDRYFLYDSDFSQEKVLWQARQAPGLVVHGPPGTGKSQTIVNLIADALAHDRKVLMVSQKHAATQIVHDRLRAAGLGELCLEVQDAEKDRRAVFKLVREQAEHLPAQPPAKNTRERERLAQEITQLESELDRYAQALHDPHPQLGQSYRQLKALEGQLHLEFPSVRPWPPLQPLVENLSAESLEELCRRIEEVGDLFARADPWHNPWRRRQPGLLMSASLKQDVLEAVADLKARDAAHLQQVARGGAGVRLPEELAAFRVLVPQLVQKLQPWAARPDALLAQALRAWLSKSRGRQDAPWLTRRQNCQRAEDLARQATAAPLDPKWHTLCADLSPRELSTLRGQARRVLDARGQWWRSFDPWFYSAKSAIMKLSPESTGEELWSAARGLNAYLEARELRRELSQFTQDLVPGLKPEPAGESDLKEFPQLAREALETADWLCHQEALHPWIAPLLDALLNVARADQFALGLSEYEKGWQRVPLVEDLLRSLRSLEHFLQPEGLLEPARDAQAGHSLSEWLERLVKGLDGLQALDALEIDRSRRTGRLQEILDALEQYEKRREQGEKVPLPPPGLPAAEHGRWWVALLKYTAGLMGQNQCHRDHPALVEITPEIHARKVRQLQELLVKKQSLEAETIRNRWLTRQVGHRQEPWKRIFQLRRSKFGEAQRLREAVQASLPCGLLDMRPCWLLNPASVAEIFPLKQGLFDLVIFDEASQCPLEQALPAIYRGNVLVVAGDEKQLPPTGFFSARWDFEEREDDDDNESAEPVAVSEVPAPVPSGSLPPSEWSKLGEQHLLHVEDLLSAAIGNLPELYLRVHYRSEHPALIDYSNHAFYEGRLEAPPTPKGGMNGGRPIQYHAVDGTYERRTNRDEARKVVALLKKFWTGDAEGPTVGVVTFNQQQRDLIEDWLEEECQKNATFRQRYEREVLRKSGNRDVGFFVKNLENVQGDERDVMVFSTTFGRDGAGRFFRRFGPVGAVGGERRLNVAVTRAKSQVVLVGSMPLHEIAGALGPDHDSGKVLTPAEYLQMYLAYAQAISQGDAAGVRQILQRLRPRAEAWSSEDPPLSPLEDDVRKALVDRGYQVHTQLGDAGFRLPLAVAHPDPARGYLLGIDCDGPAFDADRPARIREVWRDEILRRRGWKLQRIWSTRWWYYREEELRRLDEILTAAKNEPLKS